MKRYYAIIIFMSVSLLVNAQEDLSLGRFWLHNGDMNKALYNHLLEHALSQIKERWTYVDGLKTKNDWLIRQNEAKKIMAEIVGEFPAKTPLNPVITGTIKRDGFTIEKLYFESMPGYHVTAALFLPTVKKGKLPAILFCSGHDEIAFRTEAYQRCILNLVKKGFIVLAFDPIGQGERVNYFDSNGKRIEISGYKHSYPGIQSFISGRSPAHYFIWDGIRAIDYLLSRKEVDPARIGITGRSGGGTQTAYIAAMDDRILASAPEDYITSFDKLLRSKGPSDAEQNFMYALKKGFDESDLIEIRAPKPTLIINAVNDKFFSIQGARDVFKEAQNAYAALGEPGNLMMLEDDSDHVSTKKKREAMYAFFQKFLKNPGNPNDEEIEIFDEKDLWVTPTGQEQTSLKGETLYSLNEKYSAELLKNLQAEKQNNPDFYREIAQKAKSLMGYTEPELSKDYIFSGRLWRDDCFIEKYLLKGTGSYYIPVLRLSSIKFDGKTILLLDDQGKESAAKKGGLAEKLVQKGYQVIVPDMNGFGELCGYNFKKATFLTGEPMKVWHAGILTHKSPLSVRVEDIKIIVDFIKHNSPAYGEEQEVKSLTAIAAGILTSDLLHAAVIHGQFDKIALISPLISYQSIVQEKNYHPKFYLSTPAGVIGKYDLPDLVAALSPMKICMVNPVNALDIMVENSIFDQTYKKTQNLSVVFDKKNVFLKIDQWLD